MKVTRTTRMNGTRTTDEWEVDLSSLGPAVLLGIVVTVGLVGFLLILLGVGG